jgi:tetratricopeptide (TPR) repeat protein
VISDSEWQRQSERFRRLREERPEDGKMWFDYACFLRDECANPHLALRAFEKAQEYLPDWDLRPQVGAAYADAGEFDRGIAMIQEQIDEKPSVEAYVFLSEALRQADRICEAKEALEKAISIEATFEEPYFLMGRLIKEDSREKAIDYFRKAISIDPDYQLAWHELGVALTKEEGTRLEGIEALRRAIALNPDNGWSHEYLAIAYEMVGDLDAAESEYQRAIEAFPDFQLFKDYYADFVAKRLSAEYGEEYVVIGGPTLLKDGPLKEALESLLASQEKGADNGSEKATLRGNERRRAAESARPGEIDSQAGAEEDEPQ